MFWCVCSYILLLYIQNTIFRFMFSIWFFCIIHSKLQYLIRTIRHWTNCTYIYPFVYFYSMFCLTLYLLFHTIGIKEKENEKKKLRKNHVYSSEMPIGRRSDHDQFFSSFAVDYLPMRQSNTLRTWSDGLSQCTICVFVSAVRAYFWRGGTKNGQGQTVGRLYFLLVVFHSHAMQSFESNSSIWRMYNSSLLHPLPFVASV